VLRGRGRLAGQRRVEVQDFEGSRITLLARQAVVVATGSLAAVPPIEGLREISTWDNRDATAVQQIPARLVVLGGGVVGTEVAQAYRSLGADEVTVTLADGTEVTGDELLVALGRSARTDDIGLETVGLQPGGFLPVDDQLRVHGVPG
jgi:pyruvate/2-oxoglutarate dehydrogenase complex dihydrolipoamide dehydrogenase (E3) component